jgi:5'-nucleotidase
MRHGGDGYTVMRDRAVDPYDSGPALDEVVAQALSAAPFVPRTDGRIAVR